MNEHPYGHTPQFIQQEQADDYLRIGRERFPPPIEVDVNGPLGFDYDPELMSDAMKRRAQGFNIRIDTGGRHG